MQKVVILTFVLLALPQILLAHGDAHGDLIIRMTDKGFEPQELTVTEGDEVLFINNDETDRWPASNSHPNHTIYPEFDPKEAIPSGTAWKFTFDKVGTWQMHDHLIEHMSGTIVVLRDPDKSTVSLDATTTPPHNESLWVKIKGFFAKLFGVTI